MAALWRATRPLKPYYSDELWGDATCSESPCKPMRKAKVSKWRRQKARHGGGQKFVLFGLIREQESEASLTSEEEQLMNLLEQQVQSALEYLDFEDEENCKDQLWTPNEDWSKRVKRISAHCRWEYENAEEKSETKEPVNTCPVCFCDIEPDLMVALDDCCKHSVCRDCFLQHIQSRINDNKTVIRCPGLYRRLDHEEGVPCNYSLTDLQIAFVLTGAIRRDETSYMYKESSLVRKRARFRAMNFGNRLKSLSPSTLMQWKKEGLVQMCPQCLCLVGKSYGCNHMTCSCGTDFCYVCGHGFECGAWSCECIYDDMLYDIGAEHEFAMYQADREAEELYWRANKHWNDVSVLRRAGKSRKIGSGSKGKHSKSSRSWKRNAIRSKQERAQAI